MATRVYFLPVRRDLWEEASHEVRADFWERARLGVGADGERVFGIPAAEVRARATRWDERLVCSRDHWPEDGTMPEDPRWPWRLLTIVYRLEED